MVHQVLAQYPDNLYLFFRGETGDSGLQHTADACVIGGNEAGVVEEGNGAHDELTVHAIRHAAMTGNTVAEIFNLEGALQSRCKETAERRNEGSKSSQRENVKLNRLDVVRVGNW